MTTDFGDGRDGELIIGLNDVFDINRNMSISRSYADGIAYRIQSAPVTTLIDIGTIPYGFAAGDLALIINLQGTSSDHGDVGNWEIVTINSVEVTSLILTSVLSISISGSAFSNQKVIIQRIPQYYDLTILDNGILTASAYDRLVTTPAGSAGYYTGIVAVFVANTLNISSAFDRITASYKGYKGGPGGTPGGNYVWGYTGERTGGYNTSIATTSAYYSDGGGGAGKGADASGGGGGHGTPGADGGKVLASSDYGRGAPAFSSSTLQKLYFGGGGGASGSHNNRRSVSGGAGGGIILIRAHHFINNGYLTSVGANGANGVAEYDTSSGAGGGGGAGGSIYVLVGYLTTSLDSGGLIATKGMGGIKSGGNGRGPDGGDGGDGRIRIDYKSCNNLYYPDGNDILNFSSNPLPYLSEASVGHYNFYGFVGIQNGSQVGVSRKVAFYRRDTGVYMGATVSSGTGYFSFTTSYPGEHFAVAFDDESGDTYNDLIVSNIVPIYYE